jgi:hypothetical protein
MFAEDIGLLPQDLFTRLLDECRRGASSYDLIGGLFRQMNDPNPARAGRYTGVDYFNGGLFATVEPIEPSGSRPPQSRRLRLQRANAALARAQRIAGPRTI